MRAFALATVLLLFAVPATAQEVLFVEGFEPGFDGTGWSGSMGVLDESRSHSGTSCLRLDGGSGNEIMSWDLGQHYPGATFEAWFYDDMSSDLETHVSVSASDQHLSTSTVHLKVGASCAYSSGNYLVAEGWHSSDDYVVGPARTEGWHKIAFRSVGGVTECYLDGQLLHTTAFQSEWRYLILNEDNHCSTTSSWFDDLSVSVPTPVVLPFEEGFEPGFDGAGWIANQGGFQLDDTHVRTGSSALQLVDPADYYFTYDFGQPQTETLLKVWFYDDLGSVKDTHVAISGDPAYLTSGNVSLKIGTDCAYAPNSYLVSEGWHSQGFFKIIGPRSEGWHLVEFRNEGGVNSCFLDGVQVHTTSFQGDWRYLILQENNNCTDGVSWFDDVSLVSLAADVNPTVFTVGSFSPDRAGDTSFASGEFFTRAIADLADWYPNILYRESSTLSSGFLAQVDLLVVSAVRDDQTPISPLTSTEQTALHQFVLAGGRVLGLMDNDTPPFSAVGLDTPFGFSTTGQVTDSQAWVVDASSPVASGPFGVVAGFTQAFAGYFHSIVGPVSVVATNASGPALVVAEEGAFGSDSGSIAYFSDTQTFLDDGEIPGAAYVANSELFLNTFTFLAEGLPRARSEFIPAHLVSADQCRGVAVGAAGIYLARRQQPNILMVADGVGDLIDVTPSILADASNAISALWFDIDDNGRPDLYLVNKDSDNVFYYQLETGAFVEANFGALLRQSGSRTVEALDFDLDGDLDLFLTTADGTSDALLERTASGFQLATPAPLATASTSTASATADYDNDGDPDIYVVRSNEPNILARNDGGGVWTDVTPALLADEGLGNSASWGDYDGDGWLDLALTNANPPNRLFRNDQSGGFEDVTPAQVAADSSNGNAAWVDYDNDGRLDLFYTRGPGSDRLWWNDGSGLIDVSALPLSAPGNHAGAAWADMDNDGDLDLFQAEFDEGVPSVLLKNALDNGNGWLEVDLVGTTSNRFGVGSRLEVYAGGQKQIRDVLCSAGNKSQHMMTAHFGLGEAAVVDSLVVKWPSGIVQKSYNVAVSQKLRIVEDANSTAVDQPPSGRAVFALHAAVPNPFNPSTDIRFSLADSRRATLSVYDLSGRLVRTLLDEPLSAGPHSITWTGKDDSGRQVASGVYLYQLKAGDYTETKRMVLLK